MATTCKDLRQFLEVAPVDEYGNYTPDGFGEWSLQIYSSKRQVNVQKKGLSVCNITFPDENSAKVYPCPRPGYCDYSAGVEYSLDTSLSDSIPRPMDHVLVDMIKNETFLQGEGQPEE